MNTGRQLNKKEQNKIVNKTNTGGLGLSVGYSIGVKPKQAVVKTIRKRG